MIDMRQPRTLVWLTAGCAAIVTPALLLNADHGAPRQQSAASAGPIPTAPAPQLDAAFARRLFTRSVIEADALAEGSDPSAAAFEPPELVGIVGRLPDDAVAMVRAADGRTRTLGIRDSIDGWRLAALSIDAAFFTRGGERVRVDLPSDH